MSEKRILVAGIGNIFMGDDAFGVEVAQKLLRETMPSDVKVVDFGIRNYDLAYAIMDDYPTVILVDATQRGELAGTLYLIEPNLSQLDTLENEPVNSHSMNPVRVMQLVKSLGGTFRQMYLVGCEAVVFETDDGTIGLSPPVAAAVPEAVNMIKALISRILQAETA